MPAVFGSWGWFFAIRGATVPSRCFVWKQDSSKGQNLLAWRKTAHKNQKTVDISRKTNEFAWEKWKCFDIIKYCDTYIAPNLLTAAQPKQNENHYRNSSLLTEGLISSAFNCAKCTIAGEMTWRRNERGSYWLKQVLTATTLYCIKSSPGCDWMLK